MLIGLDFESDAIEARPKFPPRPAGLSIGIEGGDVNYYAFGHLLQPQENNCSIDLVRKILRDYFNLEELEFVFHNAPFDCSIIEERLDIPVPWHRVHDTMLQAFLLDPYGELSLKPLAERYLGEAPVEQDAVREWLIRAGIVSRASKEWGAHIAKAPPSIVGPYACGDVRKTLRLYRFFEAKLQAKGMMPQPPAVRYTYTPGESMTAEEAARTPR